MPRNDWEERYEQVSMIRFRGKLYETEEKATSAAHGELATFMRSQMNKDGVPIAYQIKVIEFMIQQKDRLADLLDF